MDLLALLKAHRVVGIIRGSSPELAVAAGRALVAAGVPLVEVSLVTPGALEAIAELGRVPGCVAGAGTVVTRQDAEAVASAGASFVVTPAVTEGITVAAALGMPVLGGAQTATEALSALRAGAAAVKLFPASIGGPAFLRALRDPFPSIAFVPVGGVDLPIAREYLRVGALAVGVGGPLVGDAASGGSLAALAERARAFAELGAEFA